MGLATTTDRLHRLVGLIALGGLLLQAAVAAFTVGRGPLAAVHLPGMTHDQVHGAPLVAVMVLITMASDLIAVHVRRGQQNEELTLVEAAVVIDVLLLPPHQALWVPVLASVLVAAFRRRSPVKVVFNAGNLAGATAVLVAATQLTATAGHLMGPRAVLGLLLGTVGFTAVNLVALACVLAVLEGETPWLTIRQGARMSVMMAVSTVGLGSTAVVMMGSAPALLPFSLVPAVALTFAYRAAAKESLERDRAAALLLISHVLAGRLDGHQLLAGFLRLSREAFGAELAFVVLNPSALTGATGPQTVADHLDGVQLHRPATSTELRLLDTARHGAAAITTGLPAGWQCALLAPLEADGRRLGALVLVAPVRPGWTRQYFAQHQLGGSELVLLAPLASALASALRGVAHLQRLTEESSKLQAVIDQSSDGILVLDGAGTVQIWSAALTAVSGCTEAAALGRPLATVLTTSTTDGTSCDPFLVARVALTVATPHTTVELLVSRNDAEQRIVRCAYAGVFEETAQGPLLVRVVVNVHDVTRERQVERLKADFIATVSHELRTPITPIKGYADLLRERADQMTAAKRAECLAVISDRADHLARLVEDLLLASRISATVGSTTPVQMRQADLVGLVRRACADPSEDGRRVELHLPSTPVEVWLDPVRTIQVVTNLVGNARKYSAPGSPVTVTLQCAEDQVQLAVVDQGRGIPQDQLERVFEKFHRVEDPMTMTTSGTGLGLYIARDLAGAMGGTLTCRSVLGAGSTFLFTLPLTPAPAPLGSPPPATAATSRVRRAPPWAATPPPGPRGARI